MLSNGIALLWMAKNDVSDALYMLKTRRDVIKIVRNAILLEPEVGSFVTPTSRKIWETFKMNFIHIENAYPVELEMK